MRICLTSQLKLSFEVNGGGDRVTGAALNEVARDPVASLQLVAVEAAGRRSRDRLGAVVADAARKHLDADAVVVAIWDEGRHLRILHAGGVAQFARQRLRGALESAASSLRRNGRAAATSFGSLGPARSVAAFMPPHERPPGVVVVGRRAPFSRADRAFLGALAAVSALALDHGRRPSASNMQVGDMQLDLEDHEVVVAGRRVRLTRSELRILLFLATEPGRARTRGEILRHLWKTDHVGDERACDAHISNLRRKIERDPARPDRVVTVRGAGYVLRPS
jgi:Transcriptional regulatory protein, C terminal